ncbi:ABC transporter substrate-binding protein [Martelella radicis]|uniref:Multiple sugar transport system substrate-binding protein n=1 Tax=Martelella radicis TaxID=1397476 RepID=A0A7W6PBC1_9HYPH|nr:sugar ABC transporter substrate-binding protein [Martelella radicis]MBB4123715.1 multiple sugar transport system substrate-binding protein [Martelella radicis]
MKKITCIAGLAGALLAGTAAIPANAQDLDVWIRASNDSREVYEQMAEAFETKTGIHINYFNATTDFEQRLARAAAGRELPDLLFNDATAMGQMEQMGIIEEVDRSKIEGADDIYPTAWKSAEAADGKYYGVPTSAQSFALFIRKDWREKLGLEQPKTWDELKAMAAAFTHDDPDGNGKDDTYGFILPASTTRGYASWFMSSFMWQAGGGYLAKEGDGYKAALPQEGNVEAMEFMRSLVCEGLTQPGAINATTADVIPSFRSGQTGMFFTGPYHIALLDAEPGADKIEVIAPPAGPEGVATLAEGTNVYFMKGSEKVDDARKFVEFMISPEGQTMGMAVGTGRIPIVRLPINKNVDTLATLKDERWGLFAKLYADAGRYVPTVPDWTPIRLDTAMGFNKIFADCESDIPALLEETNGTVTGILKDQGALAE